MRTVVVRVTEEAQGVALRYGSSVSKGIMEMDHRIRSRSCEFIKDEGRLEQLMERAVEKVIQRI